MGEPDFTAESVEDRIRRREASGLRTFADSAPLVWERTQGSHVWDQSGRQFLDLYAGFAVSSVGWCHPRVTDAIQRQAQIMTHTPSATPSKVRADFYDEIIGIAPEGLTRVLPAITGAMANEAAVHLARSVTGHQAVVTFAGSYYGRTSGTIGLDGKNAYRERLNIAAEATFLPFPDAYRSPWAQGREPGSATLALLEQMVSDPASGLDPIAAILVEPIQGNGGVVPAPPGFLAGLREIANRVGALLIFDEIQCGFGRSGDTWASQHDHVTPDLMTVGKGLGGGLAVGAVLGTEAVMTTWSDDTLTSTFLTNSLNLASATAAIRVLRDEDLVARSRKLGETSMALLRPGLASAPHVGDVRGRGLFIGLEIVEDRDSATPDAARATALRMALRDRGILVGQGGRFGNVVKVCPPLNIDEQELGTALGTVMEVTNE